MKFKFLKEVMVVHNPSKDNPKFGEYAIPIISDITGPDGAHYTLYKFPFFHDAEIIGAAKAEISRNFDPVSINVINVSVNKNKELIEFIRTDLLLFQANYINILDSKGFLGMLCTGQFCDTRIFPDSNHLPKNTLLSNKNQQ